MYAMYAYVNKYIHIYIQHIYSIVWVVPLPSDLVTTRIFTSLVGDPNQSLCLPLLVMEQTQDL